MNSKLNVLVCATVSVPYVSIFGGYEALHIGFSDREAVETEICYEVLFNEAYSVLGFIFVCLVDWDIEVCI